MQILKAVKCFRTCEFPSCTHSAEDPINPKDSHILSQMAPTDQIPVIPVQYQTIRIHSPFCLITMRLVTHLYSTLLLGGHTQEDHHLARSLGSGRCGKQGQGRLNRLAALAQSFRRERLDLGERTLDRMWGSRNTLPSSGDQTEKDR